MNDKLVAWINKELDDRGWSQRELARRAPVSHTTISKVLSGERDVTRDFCVAIAKGLHEPPEKVLRLAGLLPPLPSVEDKTYWELVELAKELTREERLEIYDLMRWKYQTRHQSGGSSPPKGKGSNRLGTETGVRGATKDSE